MGLLASAPSGVKQLHLFNVSEYMDIDAEKLKELYPTGRKSCSKRGCWKLLHEFDVESRTGLPRSQCKTCRRLEDKHQPTMINRQPIDQLLASLPYSPIDLHHLTGLDEGTFRPRNRKRMRSDTADRILTAIGMPHVLSELLPVAA